MPTDRTARAASADAAPAQQPNSASAWSKAGHVALFVFLAVVAVQCARLGAAGLLVQRGQIEIDRWESKSRLPSRAELNLSLQYFLDSFDYVSDNPWALEGTGSLNLAKMRSSRVPREALAATRDARQRFRQALVQRPTSPYLWANLALTKLYLNEIDGELLTALRHADELGPWEQTVQQTVVFVGLAAWREFDPELQKMLVRTLERGALRNAQKMVEIVKSYRRLDLICAIDKYASSVGPECKKAAANLDESTNRGRRQ